MGKVVAYMNTWGPKIAQVEQSKIAHLGRCEDYEALELSADYLGGISNGYLLAIAERLRVIAARLEAEA